MSRDPEAKTEPRPRLYDKRTVERNIKKGLISRKDYDKYLKSLDDISDKGVYGGPAEDDDDDEDILDDEPETDGEAPGTNSHS
jgi:hypothetical protein